MMLRSQCPGEGSRWGAGIRRERGTRGVGSGDASNGSPGAFAREASVTALAPALEAPDRQWPRHRCTQKSAPRHQVSRPGRESGGGSSDSPIPRRLRTRSRTGAEGPQPRRGRAMGRHPQNSPCGGGSPGGRREEMRVSHSRAHEDSRRDCFERGSEARRPPTREAGSDGQRLQPCRCSCGPSGSPGDQVPGTKITGWCPCSEGGLPAVLQATGTTVRDRLLVVWQAVSGAPDSGFRSGSHLSHAPSKQA
ncbi:hypothetical protein NDU88_010943 [Pleurodeles waltl]|uniref:Uncharacterized protein n=1 Tax=Pleurodeles waltl TaxID=8319 RepID=A0AAV7QW54_PLEWA|nr:hypothetical protein NDU88_010943 [Pleurodeles waltl]